MDRIDLSRDINLSFIPSPINGDISTINGRRVVTNALANLLQFNSFDIPHDPIGSGVRSLLFSNVSDSVASSLSIRIDEMIKRHIPQVNVRRVDVVPDKNNHRYDVKIAFDLRSGGEPDEFQTKISVYR